MRGQVMVVSRARVRTGQAARMDSYEGAEGDLARIMRDYGVQAVVAAPVFLGGSLWGAVIVSSMTAGPFPEGAEQRIAYFAELAAQALANAQAREDLAASRARIVQAGASSVQVATVRPRPPALRCAVSRPRRCAMKIEPALCATTCTSSDG